VGNDLSVWTLVLDASPVVQAVLVLLMLASISSWAVIFRKRRIIARSRKTADQFEADFWSGGDLNELYKRVETKGREGTGLESIFESGFREFSRLRQQNLPSDELLEGSRRAMRVAQLREIDRLEHNLAMLATVGSTSPYVGLFGTVWGIMSAFHNLGNVQQATLAAVAPGIAEALIATAIGLFAAIPAVIAYNRFSDQVSRLELRFDTFMEEFSSILQRNSGARVAPAGQAR
jgi:biopolymer transport protein TolQ